MSQEKSGGSPPSEPHGSLPGRAVRKVDRHPLLVEGVRRLRRALPGDERYGDPLSTTGLNPTAQVARLISEAGQVEPGVAREAGLAAVQLWHSMRNARGATDEGTPLAIVFTDIVGFSSWSLEAGDDATLLLLREVGSVCDPAIRRFGGEVIKWLGDGMMAVLPSAAAAIMAVNEINDGLAQVEVAGHVPVVRSGVHLGNPRRIGGDYLGVDVTIAARLAQSAGPGELLVSGAVLAALPPAQREPLRVSRRVRWRKPKGVPEELMVYAVARR